MRNNRYSPVVVLLIAVATVSVSIRGQEEPLPVIHPRGYSFADIPTPLIATAVEPIRNITTPTLAEAARANDFVTFDALFREAKRNGQNVSEYETLHELWTYAVTDPIGAFYGRDLYDRLARVYPGYTRFIEDHRIIDSRGNTFYPTSETRAFLLDRAIERRAPRVLIADTRTNDGAASSPAIDRASDDAVTPAPAPAKPVATVAEARPSRQRATAPATQTRATATPASTSSPRTTPVATGHATSVVTRETTSAPQSAAPAVARVQEQAAPATPVTDPAVTTPAAVPAPIESAPAPVIAEAEPATVPVARDNTFASRGILLLVIGLIGIGLLAVMLRTPREIQTISVIPPAAQPKAAAEAEKPVAPVEPLKRPEGRSEKKSRANGSRG